jgi:lysophospholipase
MSVSPPPSRSIARSIPADAVLDAMTMDDGWSVRRLSRAAPASMAPRGSILFLGGRGDFIEKYLETLDHWHRAGWHVTSADWRGQGGSGRFAANTRVGHVPDFAIWLADLKHVFDMWRASTPGPHVLITHSMGGHIVTRALADHSINPDAVVLIAPMMGFNAPYPDRLGLKVAGVMRRLRGAETAAWKESEKPGQSNRMRQLLLTHDADRYADELWWRQENPVVQLGPASWGWVEQAYRSFLDVRRPGRLETIKTPLLILSTSADALVSAAATRRDAARFPDARCHEYGREAAHELLREADGVRDDALSRITAFLDERVPAA